MTDAQPADVVLADTSGLIAIEPERVRAGPPPARLAVAAVTIGELRLGVLAANDSTTRARRLATLSRSEALEPLPIAAHVADASAALRIALRDAGRRMPVNDSWIAATAIAHRMPAVSQDADDDAVPGLGAIRV
ncbi:MAG: PIN domain-containing protein [Solirubrobacteraceae bacterium]